MIKKLLLSAMMVGLLFTAGCRVTRTHSITVKSVPVDTKIYSLQIESWDENNSDLRRKSIEDIKSYNIFKTTYGTFVEAYLKNGDIITYMIPHNLWAVEVMTKVVLKTPDPSGRTYK